MGIHRRPDLNFDPCASDVSVLRRGRSTEGPLDPWMGYRDHVCCGYSHPGRTHGLLCAEKPRWEIFRYGTVRTETRTGSHGNRSVGLSWGVDHL